MTRINLLPWREELIQVRNKLFAFVTGAIVFCCVVILFFMNIYVKALVLAEEHDIKLLQQENSVLDKKIAKINGLKDQRKLLLTRRDIIQSLQTNRLFIIQIFDGLTRIMPEGVYLTNVERNKNELIIEGISDTNSRVSKFMRNLEQLKWFSNATLIELKTLDTKNGQKGSTQEVVFKLQGTLWF